MEVETIKDRHEKRLQENLNDINELYDQLNYLKDEDHADLGALNRAENKIESACSQADMKQAQTKIKEARTLLDAQERLVQEKSGD